MKNAVVIALAADLAREWAADVLACPQPCDQRAEIMARLPADSVRARSLT